MMCCPAIPGSSYPWEQTPRVTVLPSLGTEIPKPLLQAWLGLRCEPCSVLAPPAEVAGHKSLFSAWHWGRDLQQRCLLGWFVSLFVCLVGLLVTQVPLSIVTMPPLISQMPLSSSQHSLGHCSAGSQSNGESPVLPLKIIWEDTKTSLSFHIDCASEFNFHLT